MEEKGTNLGIDGFEVLEVVEDLGNNPAWGRFVLGALQE